MTFLDKIIFTIIYIGMPLVGFYHQIHENVFLNVAAEDASGLEKTGDILLTPVQYLLAGKKAVLDQEGLFYELQSHFKYEYYLSLKLTSSLICMPISAILGAAVKGLSFFSLQTRERHTRILESLGDRRIFSNNSYYQSIGIDLSYLQVPQPLTSSIYKRRPGEEKRMILDKDCFREITTLLKASNIVFWVDCGTCLGTYRHRGLIPWDDDIDIAVLEPDFHNVRKVLQALNPKKYHVQDWSARDKSGTYFRVYVKETHAHIDIYHFKIDPKRCEIACIVSNEDSSYLPESWKIREGRFKVATPFDVVFPLKKAEFDGIEVFVPNKTKEYLQMRYGDNIEPAKIYNETTDAYEKDLNHPYWQRAFVH